MYINETALSTIPVSPHNEKNAFKKPNAALYIRGIILIRQIDASQTICDDCLHISGSR